MGFLSSVFGSKSKQKTDQTATSNFDTTTTRSNPQWVTDLAAQFGGSIADSSKVDPAARFAGADPLQDKAYTAAGGLGAFPGYGAKGGMPIAPKVPTDGFMATSKTKMPGGFAGTSPALDEVATRFAPQMQPPATLGRPRDPFTDSLNITRSTVGQGPVTYDPAEAKGASIMDNLDAYAAKFAPNIDAALADFDRGSGKAAAQLMLDQAGSGAFQNSGGDLERAALAAEIATSRGEFADNLRTDNLRYAAGLADADAGRQQEAGFFNAGAGERAIGRDADAARSLADIASAFGGEKRADIGLQAGLGDVYRGISGEEKNADLDAQARLQELFAGLPLELFSGQNTAGTTLTTGKSTTTKKNSPGLADAFGQAIQIAAAAAPLFASDQGVKENAVKLYERPDGLGVYLFNYIGQSAKRIGVMAQEVLKVKPEAVARHPDGYLMVDYARI